MQLKKGKDLTKGPMGKSLLMLSAPIVLGMALQTAFNIIDTFFVGMLGSEQLAAISVTFPVVFIFIAIAVGLAVGTTALVSQALGARRMKDASNIAEHSLLAALLVGVVVALLGIAFSPPLFEFMGVHGHVLDMTVSYANLIFLGFMFLFIGFLSQGIIQAGGDTITPTKNLAVSVAANIILDPIMIFGFGPVPAMGLIGAGYATVIGRSVGAFLNLFYLLKGRALVKINPKTFSFSPGILRRIFLIGWPSSFSQSINSIGMILLMSMVGAFGTGALAAFGVGIRLESLAIMPVIGIGNALVPMIGQNLGAGNLKRAKRALRLASYAVGLFMLVIMSLWYFAPEILYAPFSTDAIVLSTGADYLRIISFGYLFLGLVFVTGAAFQAAGRTTLQMLINMFRWSVIVAGAYLISSVYGITGIWWGFPLGNFMGFLVFFAFLQSGFWLRKWENGKNGKNSELSKFKKH